MKILLVEDDDTARAGIRLQIGKERDVLEASSIAEARPLLHDEALSCVVLDLHLPNGHGRELVAALTEIRDDVPVVILTGWPRDVVAEPPVIAVLRKPASGEALRGAIRDAEGWSASIERIRTSTRLLKERRAL